MFSARNFWTVVFAVALVAPGLSSNARAQAAPAGLVITDVQPSSRTLRPGQTLRVSMTIRNQGPVLARSQEPSPDTVYSQGETFAGRGFVAQPDRFTIVMSPSGPMGHEWPWRWGIGGSLALGERRRVTYPVRFTQPGIYSINIGVAVGNEVTPLPVAELAGIRVIGPGGEAPEEEVIPPTPPTRIIVNGAEVAFDQRPIVEQGTVLVPLRFIMEHLGATVQWFPQTETVTVSRGTYNILLRIGERYNRANDREIYVYIPPRVVNGRTMVPVRFVTEALGGAVFWDDRTKTVTLDVPPLPDPAQAVVPQM